MRRYGKSPDDLITATEIATAVYCLEQWRLEHGLGLEPSNRKELAAGERHHSRKAAAERVAGVAIALGRVLVATALVAVLLCGLQPMTAAGWIVAEPGVAARPGAAPPVAGDCGGVSGWGRADSRSG